MTATMRGHAGWSLIELAIALAIGTLLLALGVPGYGDT